MTHLKVKDKAPNFEGNCGGKVIKLSDYNDKYLILYFYPKDNTPGCTIEARDFENMKEVFEKLTAVVVGVSKDNAKSHESFCQKQGLNFDLISDEDGVICEKYGVLSEKTMFGKKYIGINRTTFLINPKGEIEHIWHNVSVLGHAKDVLHALHESVQIL